MRLRQRLIGDTAHATYGVLTMLASVLGMMTLFAWIIFESLN
jgi:hypothetical protein